MINPAIKYSEQMEKLTNTDDDLIKWNELYTKCYKECTHADENGESAFEEYMELRSECKYCGIGD